MRTTLLAAALLALCGCGGTAAPTVLVRDENGPRAVAADATHVYWLAAGAPPAPAAALRRVPAGGGEATTVASAFEDPRALVIAGETIYWASGDGTIRSVPAAGGAAATVATEPAGSTPFALTVLGDTVYWLANAPGSAKAFLASAPAAGGGARTVIAELPAYDAAALYPSLIANDGRIVLWSQADGDHLYLEGGQPRPLLRRQNQTVALAVVGDQAYSVQFFRETQVVIRKRIGTLDQAQVIAAVPDAVTLVHHGNALYLAGPTSNAVSRVTLPGGDTTTLLADSAGAVSVAATQAGIFAATSDGRILRIAR